MLIMRNQNPRIPDWLDSSFLEERDSNSEEIRALDGFCDHFNSESIDADTSSELAPNAKLDVLKIIDSIEQSSIERTINDQQRRIQEAWARRIDFVYIPFLSWGYP